MTAEFLEAYDTLVMSGGGTTGVALLSCLYDLARAGELDWTADERRVRTYIGTSVGALFAMLTCCRFDLFVPEIKRTVMDFCALFQWTPSHLFNGARYGLSSGEQCVNYLRKLMKRRFGKADLTMIELHHRVSADLILVSTDVRRAEPVYISHRTHPHVTVAEATFASMCIPVLFEPYTIWKRLGGEEEVFRFATALKGGAGIGGQMETLPTEVDVRNFGLAPTQTFSHDGNDYEIQSVDVKSQTVSTVRTEAQHCIDGCFSNNNPFNLAPEGASILNIVLQKHNQFRMGEHSVFKYLTRLLSLSVRRIQHMTEEHFAGAAQRDTVNIDVSGFKSTNFQLTPAQLTGLLARGHQAAAEFLQKKRGGVMEEEEGEETTRDGSVSTGDDGPVRTLQVRNRWTSSEGYAPVGGISVDTQTLPVGKSKPSFALAAPTNEAQMIRGFWQTAAAPRHPHADTVPSWVYDAGDLRHYQFGQEWTAVPTGVVTKVDETRHANRILDSILDSVMGDTLETSEDETSTEKSTEKSAEKSEKSEKSARESAKEHGRKRQDNSQLKWHRSTR